MSDRFQSPLRAVPLSGMLFMLFLGLIVCSASEAAAETAAPPLLVLGPACEQMPDGPPPTRPYAFVVFEDRNGDGAYDFYIRYACNGVAYQGPWNPQVQSDPFAEGNGIPVGALPPGTDRVYYDLHYTGSLTTAGGYTWRLDEKRLSDNTVVATWKRNGDNSFSFILYPPGTEESGRANID